MDKKTDDKYKQRRYLFDIFDISSSE